MFRCRSPICSQTSGVLEKILTTLKINSKLISYVNITQILAMELYVTWSISLINIYIKFPGLNIKSDTSEDDKTPKALYG